MFGVDVQVLKKSHGRQGQSQVHLKFDKMTPVSFAFEEGSGSFSVVCDGMSSENIANVTKLRLVVMSAQGRIQSCGTMEYERGLLRLREPGRHVPSHALDLPMLLICHEEFKIELKDVTSEVHAKSLSSYDGFVTISVSIYDMSVIPEEQLHVTATGRIAVRPRARVDEALQPPPPMRQEDDENVENVQSGVTEKEEEEEEERGGDADDKKGKEEEDEELRELARIFGTKLPSPPKKKVASPKRGSQQVKEKDNLAVSMSLEDVIEQMRIEQEKAQAEQQQRAWRASQAAEAEKAARAAEKALLPPRPPAPAPADVPAKKMKRAAKKRANLTAPKTRYEHTDTGKVAKRPFLKRGAAEERRERHVAHSKLLREEIGLAAGGKKRAPLAARGSPMKHIERGSHANGNNLTLGKKTTRALTKERARVTGGGGRVRKAPARVSYQESKDRKQIEREQRYHSRIEVAHINATASATVAWRFDNTAKIDVHDNRHLVAGEGNAASRPVKEAGGMVHAGAGSKQFKSGHEQTPWRPPVSFREPDPIVFRGG